MPIDHPNDQYSLEQGTLPTLTKLSSNVSLDLSSEQINLIASSWIHSFEGACKSNPTTVLDCFLPDHPMHPPFWRDILALTWDFRTFQGARSISKFLRDRASFVAQVSQLTLKPQFTELQRPYPDIAWIQAVFAFSINHADCTGVVRLVPLSDRSWKAHTVFTNMQGLKQYPELVEKNRSQLPNHGIWKKEREKELKFEASKPDVIVVGSGHSGLGVAARLKYMGVSTLVVEKNARVGDNWRSRYDALSLHDSVWMDHLPYLPFPSTWPVFTPSAKLADWLEAYAHLLELNVWTSSTVLSARPSRLDAGLKVGWDVVILQPGGVVRTFKNVSHLIMATGLGGGAWNFPKYPGMDSYKGKLIHSLQYKDASEHQGKKVFIVGSGTSAHDIATDHSSRGIDVTMFQRSSTYVMSCQAKSALSAIYFESGPPVDIADCLNASYPTAFMVGGFCQRMTAAFNEMDKEMLEGLDRAGFKRNQGLDDTGLIRLAWQRAGGYYIDTGASSHIIDGRIKIKGGTQIAQLTETGILFEDGSEVQADVVIFATGLGDSRETVRSICGDEVAARCTPIWGLDTEGELNGCWREFGVPHLWYMSGGLAQCRFHSKHVALQIKAMELGIYGPRYANESREPFPDSIPISSIAPQQLLPKPAKRNKYPFLFVSSSVVVTIACVLLYFF